MKKPEKRKTGFDKIKKNKSSVGAARKPKVFGGAGSSASPRAVWKGQVKIDFIFALVFFTVVVFYIGLYINGVVISSLADSKLDTMKSEAEAILDALVSAEGFPENWETLTEDRIVRIGLAQSPYNLSSGKVAALNNNCNLMNKFGSISYRLAVTAGGSNLLSCGYGGPRVTSRAERPVLINNNYGKITLEMW